jgi:hypothetical protein
VRIESYNSEINLEDMETLQIVIEAVPFEEGYIPAFVIMSPEDQYPMTLDELNALMDGIEIARDKVDEIITYIIRKKLSRYEDGEQDDSGTGD